MVFNNPRVLADAMGEKRERMKWINPNISRFAIFPVPNNFIQTFFPP